MALHSLLSRVDVWVAGHISIQEGLLRSTLILHLRLKQDDVVTPNLHTKLRVVTSSNVKANGLVI